MTVFDGDQIPEPVEVNADARIDCVIYSDKGQTTVQDLSGKTVTAEVKGADGNWNTGETVTVDDAAAGQVHVTLTGTNYGTAGDGELRWYVDGHLCFPRFTLTWIEEPA